MGCITLLQHMCGNQRTTFWSKFSPSTFVSVLGIELRSQTLHLPSHLTRPWRLCSSPIRSSFEVADGSNAAASAFKAGSESRWEGQQPKEVFKDLW